MYADTIPRNKGSRSQLATNRFLIALGQTFGSKEFTSRHVANRFGVDFLNTAKVLSRMARKPYSLLSVRKMARHIGGVENVYTISPRGWLKICYLKTQPTAPVKEPSRGSLAAASYMITAKGAPLDTFVGRMLKTIEGMMPISQMDETGQLLSSFDAQTLLGESAIATGKFAEDEQLKTAYRCGCLQRLGLIPSEIDIPTYLQTAFELGASAPTILLGLLIRGGIRLRDELISARSELPAAKISPAVNPSAYAEPLHQTMEHSPFTIGTSQCEKCHDYKMSLEHAKFKGNMFEIKNAILERDIQTLKRQLELSEARKHLLQENNRMNTACLDILLKEVEKFNLPLEAIPFKSLVNTGLAALVLLNEAYVSSNM